MKKVIILSSVCIGYTLLLGGLFFLFRYQNIDKGMEITNFNENIAKQFAINLFFRKLESIGKISLAVIGVLLAFVFLKGYRIQFNTKSQILLFLIPIISLIGSFIFYLISHDLLLSRLFYHSTIDLEAPIVKTLCRGQLYYFIIGLVWFFLTIVLCRNNNGNVSRGDK